MEKPYAIKTEYTHGSIGGVDYGSRARVLMRSPDALMFVAYGVNIAQKGVCGHPEKLCERASSECLNTPRVRDRIETIFGKGAADAAILSLSKKGLGTVLFNGGGDKLPLPSADARVVHQNRYESITPSRDLPPEQVETCLQCSAPLRLATTHHRFTFPNSPEKPPTSIDELQRLTNYPIVRMRGFPSNSPEEWWPYIEYFDTWDGESYLDDTFCSDQCAAIYGRRAAAELDRLPANGKPPTRVYKSRDTVYHYDQEAEATRQRISIEESFAKRKS